jgi:hypothetical protein
MIPSMISQMDQDGEDMSRLMEQQLILVVLQVIFSDPQSDISIPIPSAFVLLRADESPSYVLKIKASAVAKIHELGNISVHRAEVLFKEYIALDATIDRISSLIPHKWEAPPVLDAQQEPVEDESYEQQESDEELDHLKNGGGFWIYEANDLPSTFGANGLPYDDEQEQEQEQGGEVDISQANMQDEELDGVQNCFETYQDDMQAAGIEFSTRATAQASFDKYMVSRMG